MSKEKLREKPNNVTSTNKKASEPKMGGSLFEMMDRSLEKAHPWLIWLSMGLTLLFSLLLYDPKVSLTGDDSFYIIRASEFIHSFKYPAFQGPLFPMVLGLVVAIFGISLTPLKLFSMVAMLASIYLIYRTFRNRIPATILVIVIALSSINGYLLYYASQAYSEAFYILMQILMVLVFFNYFIDQDKKFTFREDLKRHFILAFILLLLTLTRSIGYSALMAAGAYFLLKGQWKNLAYFILAFGAVFIAFQGIKYALWSEGGLQFSNQGTSLLNKDYYAPQDGKEDFGGLIKRFFDNSNLYLSKHFLYMTGFRTYAPVLTLFPLLTILIYLLAIIGLGYTYLKNNYLFFTGLVAGAFLLVTFVVLQAKWDQGRLIIPAFSFLLMLVVAALYYMFQQKNLKILQFVLPLIAVISFFQTIGASATQIKEARKESGRFGGLTPDWKHYLQASEWAASNLPEDAVIACRKPSISFVYGEGRNFYGIMQLPAFDKDRFFSDWKNSKGSYVAYSYDQFEGKQLPPDLIRTLKQNIVAQFFAADKVYFIDNLPDSLRTSVIGSMSAFGIQGTTSPDSLSILRGKDDKATTLIYPDSLLLSLHKNNVSYVLTANLRRNSLVKNGQIINTVERYMAFIQDKYPGITSKVVQIGADENEPATIMKLEYEKAGLKGIK
ncbi:MAG: hypothetical protein IPH45_09555 [Bacteroidales bacterium]|nr:hypothetical protein [Bacteroidales bacterium]